MSTANKKPKKRKNSRSKGKVGELELAHYLAAAGYPARRGQQFAGGTDSPDVVCPALGNFHIECKRTESLNLYAALSQSIRDAKFKTPLVIHRKNSQDWVVIMKLDDFLNHVLLIGV